MNSPARDIVGILQSSPYKIGVFATDMFVSREPTKPDDCTTIFDTGGPEPAAVDQNYERPTIMVRVRNRDYETGFNLITEIKDILHGYSTTINNTRYVGIWAMQNPTFIGYDSNNHALFTVNFLIHRTPAT